jgi:hypothetical protein
MNWRRFMTRILGLSAQRYTCDNGPMKGETLVLTEESRSSAWLELRGEVGRYVVGADGRLVWERHHG